MSGIDPIRSTDEAGNEPAHLTERFYGELRRLAQRAFASERNGHTLQPTAVVNEACLRMMTTSPLPDCPPPERLALAARVLDQVLIDYARGRGTSKRGGSMIRVPLHDGVASTPDRQTMDVSATSLRGALDRLRTLHERQADVVTLRIFGGLSMEQVAAQLGVSKRSVEADWTIARAWLRRALDSDRAEDSP